MVAPKYLQGEVPKSKEAYSRLLKLAIPSIIEMVFMSLIGSVDVVMVSRLGVEAIAAVGLAGQPRFILLAMFFALNVGLTAIVARRKGENRPSEANRALRNALLIALMIVAVLVTLALLFSREIMLIAGAKPETSEMAATYFQIMIYFLPVEVITICINAAQRGAGNTRTPLFANLTANIVNIIFDYCFIYGNFGFPKLGVAGDAWASGIGLCVGLILSLYGVLRNNKEQQFLHLSFSDDWRLHKETVQAIFKIGGNSLIEQVAQRLGLFVYAIVIANLGTKVFAAHQVGMQFLSFSFQAGNGLSAASTSLVGQMLGKKRPDHAIIYGKCSQRLALLISLLIASSIIIFRYPLVSIFLSSNDPNNAESIILAVKLLYLVAAFQPFQTTAVVLSGCLRGAGDNFFVAIVFIVCVAIIRPLFSIIAVNLLGWGLMGAWGASIIDISLRVFLVQRRFAGSKWHNIAV